MASSNSNHGEGNGEAALFEAISHPTRIRILFALEFEQLGFALLRRNVGLSSSGNLQHHIAKLSKLLGINSNGDYMLTDQGREALIAIKSVRNQQNSKSNDSKIITFIIALSYYLVQMNLPFLFGTVNEMTPLMAISSAFLFGIIFYPMFSWNYSRRLNKTLRKDQSLN